MKTISNMVFRPTVLYWGAVVIILYTFIFGQTGFLKLYKMWNESNRLEKEIEIAQQRNVYLQREVEDLKDPNDLSRLELEARKKGMAARDEVVILVR